MSESKIIHEYDGFNGETAEERAARKRRSSLDDNLEIARQLEEAGWAVAEKFPVAARFLLQEAERVKGWP